MGVPLLDKTRCEKLIHLARERFDSDLSDAEQRILTQSAGSADADLPSEVDPQPAVRPELIRWLATNSEASNFIDQMVIRVWSATISGNLNFNCCRLLTRLEFRHCLFEGEVNLVSARAVDFCAYDSTFNKAVIAGRLTLDGPFIARDSRFLEEIVLTGARVGAEVDLSRAILERGLAASQIRINSGFSASGVRCANELNLAGAQIDAPLDLSRASLTSDRALSLNGAEVRNSVYLNYGFEALGLIDMRNANIGGALECQGAKLRAPNLALTMYCASVRNGVNLCDGFQSFGQIMMSNSSIGGDVNCSGAEIHSLPKAIRLDAARVTGNVYFSNNFRSSGEIDLRSVRIEGGLSCDGARLTASESALNLSHAHIRCGVSLGGGMESSGTVSMRNSIVGQGISCFGAQITAMGDALLMDEASIGGTVSLDGGFRSSGKISLMGAEICGDLSCVGASLTSSGDALIADKATIKGFVFLRAGFRADGQIRLASARIAGNLDCNNSTISKLSCVNAFLLNRRLRRLYLVRLLHLFRMRLHSFMRQLRIVLLRFDPRGIVRRRLLGDNRQRGNRAQNHNQEKPCKFLHRLPLNQFFVEVWPNCIPTPLSAEITRLGDSPHARAIRHFFASFTAGSPY